MRVIMTGGGTGGHIYPAVAIADEIRRRDENAEILFVGAEIGMEGDLVPKCGYEITLIPADGFNRKKLSTNFVAVKRIVQGTFKVKKIIKEFKPDIVIGTGGYACWPAVKAAAELRIPTVLHESNSYPGMAVRKLQEKVDIILTNFESTKEKLSPNANVINVGNPVRRDCTVLTKSDARARLGIDSEKFVVLSFGGSLGAECLNNAAVDYMQNFAASKEDVISYHVGGRNYYDDAVEKLEGKKLLENKRNTLISFTNELPLYMAAADVVICRAGAMTITEIARMGKAAIIIPSVHVTDNHQFINAKSLSDAGAAVLVEEAELEKQGRISEELEALYSDPERRIEMSEKVKAFASEDVEKRIFEAINDLLKNYKKIVK